MDKFINCLVVDGTHPHHSLISGNLIVNRKFPLLGNKILRRKIFESPNGVKVDYGSEYIYNPKVKQIISKIISKERGLGYRRV